MSLIMKRTERGHAPVIICDHCKKPIREARDGNTEWTAENPERVYHTHKECCWQFEHANGGRTMWLADELQATFVFLIDHNCKVHLKEARENAHLIEMFP